ncbi:MAG: PfkB family carbohydrate kinase [Oceanicaulis sp.]
MLKTSDRSVIVISSLVSGARVGGGLTSAALERDGWRAELVPTVIMGRHPGQGAPGGGAVSAQTLASTLDAMLDQGRAEAAHAILTGYFRHPDQVKAAARFVKAARRRNPHLTVLVDPILGDGEASAGRLYIAEETARAIGETLIPLADIITPNLFELSWLTGRTLTNEDEIADAARALAPAALVTSARNTPDRVGALVVTPSQVWRVAANRVEPAPNGTGDLFAATALSRHLSGALWPDAAEAGAARVWLALDAARTAGAGELLLPAGPVRGAQDAPGARLRRTAVSDVEPVWVMGVDGAPGGWAAVSVDLYGAHPPKAEVFERFEDVLATPAQIIAVDMPIGFEDAPSGPGGRACERTARALLGPRRSSVFSTPLRSALEAETYQDALARNRAAGGPGLSKQAFHLFPKLREVDAVMAPDLEGVVFEVHPELVFTAVSGQPAEDAKRTGEGRAERLALLTRHGLPHALFEPHPFKRKACAPDDLVDAGLCALAARRIAAGVALQLPDGEPPRDRKGLRMAIFA